METSASRPKLLVVDDSELLRHSAARMFRLAGFDVSVADGVDAAERLVRAQRFDVALVDLEMPVADGFATIARISAIDPEFFGRAILYTAAADSEDVVERAARSRIALLSKSCDCKVVIAAIRERMRTETAAQSSVFPRRPSSRAERSRATGTR